LPIISYNDFTDEKGQHFYVPNYGIKTPTPPIDRDLATEIAQRPVMQNVPLQTNKMKSKVKGANNKYMKNVGMYLNKEIKQLMSVLIILL
jgi:hypothetical protein